MLREAVLSAVLLTAAFALLPAAPALPAAGCDALGLAEASLQSDAGQSGDAPDTPEVARRVGNDGYYSGYLSAIGHANADRVDWYVYAVPAGIDAMNANITWEFPVVPLYTLQPPPTYLQMFTMTVFPPEGAPVSITPYDPTLTIPSPAPGDYLVRITATTAYELDGCGTSAQAPPATDGTTHARNHGMYLGCDPLCAS